MRSARHLFRSSDTALDIQIDHVEARINCGDNSSAAHRERADLLVEKAARALRRAERAEAAIHRVARNRAA